MTAKACKNYNLAACRQSRTSEHHSAGSARGIWPADAVCWLSYTNSEPCEHGIVFLNMSTTTVSIIPSSSLMKCMAAS
jgi:hypothetical protein